MALKIEIRVYRIFSFIMRCVILSFLVVSSLLSPSCASREKYISTVGTIYVTSDSTHIREGGFYHSLDWRGDDLVKLV